MAIKKIKKAQRGERVNVYMTDKEYNESNRRRRDSLEKRYPKSYIDIPVNHRGIDPGFDITPKEDSTIKRKRTFSKDGELEFLRKGGKVTKKKSIVKPLNIKRKKK